MKEFTSMNEAMSRYIRIREGDTDTANKWAEQLAGKLATNEPLHQAEASFLAVILLIYAGKGEAARLWNLGVMPHKSNSILRDYELYQRVNKHVATGESRKKAIELVCKELNYAHGQDDDPFGTATFRYDKVAAFVRKQLRELPGLEKAFDEESSSK